MKLNNAQSLQNVKSGKVYLKFLNTRGFFARKRFYSSLFELKIIFTDALEKRIINNNDSTGFKFGNI